MAHYIENKKPIVTKKSTGKWIRQILIVFGIFLIVGFFFFRDDSSESSPLKHLKLNPKSKYVSEGKYTFDDDWRTLKFDPKLKFDYKTFDNFSCVDKNGKPFEIGSDIGLANVANSNGYDLTEISFKTKSGEGGSIDFTNFRK